MKCFATCLAVCTLLVSLAASADESTASSSPTLSQPTIQPVCALKGPVYMEWSSPTRVEGYIGQTWVSLRFHDGVASGTIKGHPMTLALGGSRLLSGNIGEVNVSYRVNEDSTAIYGFQPCVVNIADANQLAGSSTTP